MSVGDDESAVLVTGSGSGIGRASAKLFADNGWTVYATDINTEEVTELETLGCRSRQMDVPDRDSIASVVEDIRVDDGTLDCVVNNAGIAELGALEDVPVEAVREEFNVNIHGPLRVCQAALPLLRASPHGRIVNVSSVFGRVSAPGTSAYSASKFALEGMSDALRRELAGTDVDVALVEPAWVQTPFLDHLRENIRTRNRTAVYERIYRVYEQTDIIGGWSFTIDPETAAREVVTAATVDDPDARYLVGRQPWLFEIVRVLPTRFVDWLSARLFRVADLFTEE